MGRVRAIIPRDLEQALPQHRGIGSGFIVGKQLTA